MCTYTYLPYLHMLSTNFMQAITHFHDFIVQSCNVATIIVLLYNVQSPYIFNITEKL